MDAGGTSFTINSLLQAESFHGQSAFSSRKMKDNCHSLGCNRVKVTRRLLRRQIGGQELHLSALKVTIVPYALLPSDDIMLKPRADVNMYSAFGDVARCRT